ncbi:MAG: TrkH family potassium uptake protein [Candidatus Marinimicrobia bacterium]|nr:TrkH family potassium uptake protein [bacterium]MCG2715456.1 TrkH family potassium uptake protein [Candidatus Neomarinimicrobiota bacterium]
MQSGYSKRNFIDQIVVIVLFLSILSLFLEYGIHQTRMIFLITNILDYCIIVLFISEAVMRISGAEKRLSFIRNKIFDHLLLIVILALFIYTRYMRFVSGEGGINHLPINIILIRNAFNILKILSRVKRLNAYIKSVSRHPAQTIAFSFIIVILLGTVFLMLSISTADNSRLGFVNSLFTATSAVCVTGLIVVDTATKFSLFGKVVIMILIQIGGLGIMILSYFGAYVIGKRISLEEKIAISYLLNEQDMQKISTTIMKIIFFTFGIELVGAMLLFGDFNDLYGDTFQAVFFSMFHAVSAFCNAGFALFSNSFESFKTNISINFIITGLIITGGISFSVVFNLIENFKTNIKTNVFSRRIRKSKLTLNTKVVVISTLFLIFGGMLLIYGIEHRGNLVRFDLKTQYLAVFFQSVTLRTAGFNTIDIATLRIPTLFIMVLFMFIGGASGSTAGGVKVNTVSVIFAYLKSTFNNRKETTLMNSYISKRIINKSFLIVLLSLGAVFIGTFILSLVEPFSFERILFEVVSAFGTVGLSTGITGSLTQISKIMIIILMFVGRIGPMTLIIALSQKPDQTRVKYPEGNILIG